MLTGLSFACVVFSRNRGRPEGSSKSGRQKRPNFDEPSVDGPLGNPSGGKSYRGSGIGPTSGAAEGRRELDS